MPTVKKRCWQRLPVATWTAYAVACAGFAVCAWSLMPINRGPLIWVQDLSEDLGVIDGDVSHEQSFTVLNMQFRPIELEVLAPGCGCDGRAYQRKIVPALARTKFIIVTDPSKLPVGPSRHTITIRGVWQEQPFSIHRIVRMTIRRPEIEEDLRPVRTPSAQNEEDSRFNFTHDRLSLLLRR